VTTPLRQLPAPRLAGGWKLDPAASSVTFTIGHFGLFSVTGTFPVRSGGVEIDSDGSVVRLEAAVGTEGFETGNPRRDKEVRGRHFLDSAQFPEMIFRTDRATLSEKDWKIDGTLTVKDKTLPQTLLVDAGSSSLLGQRGNRVEVQATTEVDRRAYGVSARAGLVGPVLKLRIKAVFTRLPA
jgi:polyisoprenoid-binding protein YceI